MMLRLVIFYLLLLHLAGNLNADPFVVRSFDSNGRKIPYELVIPPGYDKTKSYPAVLFYHGTEQQGDDILDQMGVGAIGHPATQWEGKYPTFVIFVQDPGDQQDAHEILSSVEAEFNIDKNHICIRGLPFMARTYVDSSGVTLPYELYVPPNSSKTQTCPVIIAFHGSGERGSDNFAQFQNGLIKYASPEFQAKYPSIVIIPQCPSDQKWVDMDWSAPSSVRPPQPTVPMQMVLKILDGVTSEFGVDTTREYVLGLSMGGYATWDCVTRYPDRFAAGVVWCGGGDENTVTAEVARVPVWAHHSSDDPVVPVARDRNMVEAMIKMGGHPRYTEYNWLGHYAWAKAFDDSELYFWLFQQRLDQRPPITK